MLVWKRGHRTRSNRAVPRAHPLHITREAKVAETVAASPHSSQHRAPQPRQWTAAASAEPSTSPPLSVDTSGTTPRSQTLLHSEATDALKRHGLYARRVVVYSCLFVCLFGWLVGWLFVWLFGCLVVWLFGCLVVWLFVCRSLCSTGPVYLTRDHRDPTGRGQVVSAVMLAPTPCAATTKAMLGRYASGRRVAAVVAPPHGETGPCWTTKLVACNNRPATACMLVLPQVHAWRSSSVSMMITTARQPVVHSNTVLTSHATPIHRCAHAGSCTTSPRSLTRGRPTQAHPLSRTL